MTSIGSHLNNRNLLTGRLTNQVCQITKALRRTKIALPTIIVTSKFCQNHTQKFEKKCVYDRNSTSTADRLMRKPSEHHLEPFPDRDQARNQPMQYITDHSGWVCREHEVPQHGRKPPDSKKRDHLERSRHSNRTVCRCEKSMWRERLASKLRKNRSMKQKGILLVQKIEKQRYHKRSQMYVVQN